VAPETAVEVVKLTYTWALRPSESRGLFNYGHPFFPVAIP